MENWVAFHGGRKVQLISMVVYFLDNLKSAQPFEVKFRRGACGLNVSAEEPNLISDFVHRGG